MTPISHICILRADTLYAVTSLSWISSFYSRVLSNLQNNCQRSARDTKGRTPLHAATAKGFEHICKLIINSNIVDKNPPDNLGNTPYQAASTNGHKHVCKLILESKKPTSSNSVINPYDGGGCIPSER